MSSWFVLEIETGLMDGIYHEELKINPQKIAKLWDQERPGYQHVVCYPDKTKNWWIPDDRHLTPDWLKAKRGEEV